MRRNARLWCDATSVHPAPLRPLSEPLVVCGEVDGVTGTVCTQERSHAGLRVTNPNGLASRMHPRRHIDATDPGCLFVWGDVAAPR